MQGNRQRFDELRGADDARIANGPRTAEAIRAAGNDSVYDLIVLGERGSTTSVYLRNSRLVRRLQATSRNTRMAIVKKFTNKLPTAFDSASGKTSTASAREAEEIGRAHV